MTTTTPPLDTPRRSRLSPTAVTGTTRAAAVVPRSPRRATSGILGSMNREWDHLAHSPTTHPDGTPWAVDHPALQGLATVTEVLDALRRCPSGSARADELLRALLDLKAAGTELAGRALIHTMMPRILRLVFTADARGVDDPNGAALEAMWTAISRFPTTKTHRVASCLALNALNRLQYPGEPPLALEPTQVEVAVDQQALAGRVDPVDGPTPESEVARLLAWAGTQGVLARADVELLRVLHRGDAPSQAELAQQLGVSKEAMWQRASRATSRLRRAVATAHTVPGR